ncbi:MAG: hypothetical protein ACYDER_01245 [Ktedonobacteraceae bacterium]
MSEDEYDFLWASASEIIKPDPGLELINHRERLKEKGYTDKHEPTLEQFIGAMEHIEYVPPQEIKLPPKEEVIYREVYRDRNTEANSGCRRGVVITLLLFGLATLLYPVWGLIVYLNIISVIFLGAFIFWIIFEATLDRRLRKRG